MKITIPQKYQKYINAMYEVGILKEKEDFVKMFKQGIEDTIEDLEIGAGDFPPDMNKNLLRGKLIEIDVRYELTKREKEHVKRIRKVFRVTEKTILRAFFLCGLFEYYLPLIDTKRYKKDIQFRKLIDSMPHEIMYEERACDKNETHSDNT